MQEKGQEKEISIRGGGDGGNSVINRKVFTSRVASVSVDKLICICINHSLLPTFICRDVTSFSILTLDFLGEGIISHLLHYHGSCFMGHPLAH